MRAREVGRIDIAVGKAENGHTILIADNGLGFDPATIDEAGGGSCVVQPCTTAAGTLFQISGSKQISIIKNGSFYNTDAGIEPDFRLEKPESFYDRPALVEYLHNLK